MVPVDEIKMKSQLDYEFYKSKGFCVACRKEKAAPHRVRCPACLEKERKTMGRYRKSLSEEEAARQQAHRNMWHKNRYERRAAAGLCVVCGGKSSDDHKLCRACRLRKSERYYERRSENG